MEEGVANAWSLFTLHTYVRSRNNERNRFLPASAGGRNHAVRRMWKVCHVIVIGYNQFFSTLSAAGVNVCLSRRRQSSEPAYLLTSYQDLATAAGSTNEFALRCASVVCDIDVDERKRIRVRHTHRLT